MKPIMITVVILVLFAAGLGGGYVLLTQMRPQDEPAPAALDTTPVDRESTEHGKSIVVPANAAICAEHRVPEMICPFCQPTLIEERGQCGVHGVAEALCTRCSPVLIAAFKAENDWCAEHGLPESQCVLCGGVAIGNEKDSESIARGDEICAEHQVPESICPFCDPSLIEELGHCGGHDVPEAFCTRCNVALIPAFKAESDWCGEHGLPESQCLKCNPSSDG